ncbi:hypothetical protein LINPERHAP1_LOCUS8305, partial [Linum perenne]
LKLIASLSLELTTSFTTYEVHHIRRTNEAWASTIGPGDEAGTQPFQKQEIFISFAGISWTSNGPLEFLKACRSSGS